MESYLYGREGSPVKIVEILSRTDRGIEIQTEKFDGFAADGQPVQSIVTRFYPWTAVDYIETV